MPPLRFTFAVHLGLVEHATAIANVAGGRRDLAQVNHVDACGYQ